MTALCPEPSNTHRHQQNTHADKNTHERNTHPQSCMCHGPRTERRSEAYLRSIQGQEACRSTPGHSSWHAGTAVMSTPLSNPPTYTPAPALSPAMAAQQWHRANFYTHPRPYPQQWQPARPSPPTCAPTSAPSPNTPLKNDTCGGRAPNLAVSNSHALTTELKRP